MNYENLLRNLEAKAARQIEALKLTQAHIEAIKTLQINAAALEKPKKP